MILFIVSCHRGSLFAVMCNDVFVMFDYSWCIPVEYACTDRTLPRKQMFFILLIPFYFSLKASSSPGSSNSKIFDHFVGMGFSEKLVSKVIQENGKSTSLLHLSMDFSSSIWGSQIIMLLWTFRWGKCRFAFGNTSRIVGELIIFLVLINTPLMPRKQEGS